MNKRLWIGFLVIIPVFFTQAADRSSGSSLAKKSVEKFNFATDSIEAFPFDAFAKNFPKEEAEGLNETLCWVVLCTKLQNGPLDQDIIRKIHNSPEDDFFKPMLKFELVLKKIAENPAKLNDFDEESYKEDDELSCFIHSHCSKKDIRYFKKRVVAELKEAAEDLPKELGKLPEDSEIAVNLESEENHNRFKSLQFILKFDEKRRRIAEYHAIRQEEYVRHFRVGRDVEIRRYEYVRSQDQIVLQPPHQVFIVVPENRNFIQRFFDRFWPR